MLKPTWFKRLAILVGTLSLLVVATITLLPNKQLLNAIMTFERVSAGLEVKSVTISSGNVAYVEGGTGPTLLLIHGFGANKDNWNRIAKHLKQHFHLIAIDLPGFGDSSKNLELNYDVAAQVQRLNEITQALNIDDFYIAGNSMGGYIAGNYVVTYPQQVRGLWLLNPLGVESAPNSEMFELIGQGKQPVVLVENKAQYLQLMTFVFHNVPFIPDFLINALAEKSQLNVATNTAIFYQIHKVVDNKVVFSAPLDVSLKQNHKPVLITWGDKDRILHPAGGPILDNITPNSTLNMMPNVGHAPMIEVPKQTADQFIAFVEGIALTK